MDIMIKRGILLIFAIASVALIFYAVLQLNWSKMLSPGPLSPAHAELGEKGKCNACHTKGKRLDTDKCLDCHREIKSMMQNKRGFHARVTKKCDHCHSEHHIRLFNTVHFDAKDFDHSMAGSPLGGKHLLLRCEVCHEKVVTCLISINAFSVTRISIRERMEKIAPNAIPRTALKRQSRGLSISPSVILGTPVRSLSDHFYSLKSITCGRPHTRQGQATVPALYDILFLRIEV